MRTKMKYLVLHTLNALCLHSMVFSHPASAQKNDVKHVLRAGSTSVVCSSLAETYATTVITPENKTEYSKERKSHWLVHLEGYLHDTGPRSDVGEGPKLLGSIPVVSLFQHPWPRCSPSSLR